ncbi:hypothetical protein E2320_014659, partial [Naja naja]
LGWTSTEPGEPPCITSSGFQFLLLDTSSQLCFSTLGKRKSRRYYPTRLAINLSSGISGTTMDTHNQGFIVVETNYRIYAYTGLKQHRFPFFKGPSLF